MSRIALLVVLLLVPVMGLLLIPHPGHASLYSPDDPMANPVSPTGKPDALPFREFRRRLAVVTNAAVEPKPGESVNEDRAAFLKRIAAAEKLRNPSTRELTALATDLLRTGQLDKALNLLGPRTRDARADYFVFTTLGHIHATKQEWSDALRYHTEGQFDTQMPPELKGLTKQQRDWWAKLDAEYVPHFYQIRKHEMEARKGLSQTALDKLNEVEDVLPLFPLPRAGTTVAPVRFVNHAGVYEPGNLAIAEREKLPPDAIAIVQQLMLWFPGETRLYWLLAELYAAAGDAKSAVAILDECTWGAKYGSRKILRDHRNTLRAIADAMPQTTPPEDVPLSRPTTDAPEPEPELPPESPISMRTVWIYFGVVALVGVLALVRFILRRRVA